MLNFTLILDVDACDLLKKGSVILVASHVGTEGNVVTPLEWLRREWVVLAGLTLSLTGAFYGARSGLSGFTVVAGAFGAIVILAVGLLRPKLAPYIVVAFAIFDRDLHLSPTLELSTLTVVLLLLAPGFLKTIAEAKVIPQFALVGAGMITLGLVAASLGAEHPELSWPGLLRWIPVLIMVGGVASLCATQPAVQQNVGIALVVGGGVSGLLGLLQRGGHYWLVGPPYVAEVTDSTFGYYTNFANFEALAAVVGVGVIIDRIRAKRRPPLLLTGCSLLCLYMVATLYSRGAVVLLGAGLLVIVVRHVKRPARFISAVAGLALAGYIVVQLAPEYSNEIVAKFTMSQNGDIVRNQLQAGGFNVLLSTPLGIGFDNFSSLVASGDVYSTKALAHAHNTFIQMGLDAGWVGGTGFLVLVAGCFWRGFRSEGSNVSLAFCAALAGYLVQVAQDYFFFEEGSLALFGLLLAGSLGMRQKASEKCDAKAIPRPATTGNSRPSRGALPTLGLSYRERRTT